MANTAPRLATYEDLEALAEGERGEILAGQLVALPAPLPRHSKVQGALRRFIGGPFDDDDGHGGPGGWWIFIEVDVRFTPHDIVRPDLAGWRRENLPAPGNLRPIDVRPDWVCEIHSPSTASADRVKKRALYARHGVPHYWLLDPEVRTLEALQLDARRWTELGVWDDSAKVTVPPFDDVVLDVARLFLSRDVDPPRSE